MGTRKLMRDRIIFIERIEDKMSEIEDQGYEIV